ncbi:MAG: efflux RND transporter permease subunit [Gammaproteobacteria bacterium]
MFINHILDRPKSVIVATLVAVAVVAIGAARLTVTNDMRAYFSADNPQLAALDAMEAVFDKEDNAVFLVVAHAGDLFERRGLTLVHELTALGWQTPYSRRVDSLANFQYTHAQGDELIVEDLVADPARLDDERIAAVKDIALAEPTLVNRVVSQDGRATGIYVALTLPEGNLDANDEVTEWARGLLPSYRSRYPDYDIHLGGTTVANVSVGEAVVRDVRSLVALSYAIIFVGLAILLRSFVACLATLAVVSFSVAMTMGAFGWMGATLEAVAGFVPSIVMTIAVADSVHVIATYAHQLRQGVARREAVAEAMRINVVPVALTSITTAIGVLMLNFSDSPPYRDLGNMVAVGVMAAWALSMTLLPALLCVLPAGGLSRGRGPERLMGRLAEFVIARRKALLVVMGVSVVLVASFIPRNQLSERWQDYFDSTFEVRRTLDALEDTLRGMHAIRYALDSGADQGINDPEFLRALEDFERWYAAEPGVVFVSSITETLRRLNRNLHGDDPVWHRLPEASDLTAQYLLLYELSLPQGLGLENTIDVARRTTQMVTLLESADSEQIIAIDERAQRLFKERYPHYELSEGTGIDMVFAHINHRNIHGLLEGMAVALILISVLLVVALRSWKLGWLALMTNLAPAALAYGAWGMTVGWIDTSAAVVICMSIGIVVDDTVHFLSKYLRARREQGLDAAGGIRYAFEVVGVALTTTTIVLVAGFATLAASHFNPTVTTGTLLALTLVFALLVDFLLLPPLLLVLDTRSAPATEPARSRRPVHDSQY